MKKQLLFTFYCLLGLLWQAWAQDRTVTGRVTDAKTGEPLPGVTVIVKGTSNATATDFDGNYKINVKPGAVLAFSSISYVAQEIAVGVASVIDVKLQPDTKQLEDVVVIGYGVQERREVSGSVGSVKGEDIRNLPIPSVDRAIQGRVAGVQITGVNGIPGGATQVRIRGIGSVNGGNEPLYVIDGVPMTAGDRSRRIASSNVLNVLNNNDIESIEVLKDASAASIYGAQAANGVILITTKKGKAGKTKFDVNYYTGYSDVIRKIPLLTGPEWIRMRIEATRNRYTYHFIADPFVPGSGQDLQRPSRWAITEVQSTYGSPEVAPNYDWQQAVTRRGAIQNLEFSANGGTDNVRYFLGASYNEQRAQLIATDIRRVTLRANLDAKLTKKLSFEGRFNFTNNKQDSPFNNAFNTNNQIVTALGIIPLNSPFLPNGAINASFAYPGVLGASSNPLLQSDVNILVGRTNQLIANTSFVYELAPGLSFRSNYGVDFNDVVEDAYFDARTPGGAAAGGGSVSAFQTRVININTDQLLTYDRAFLDRRLKLNSILGFNYRREEVTGFNAAGTGVLLPAFGQTMAGTTPSTVNTVYSIFKLAGYFGRVNLTFDDKYILAATIRRDGSSRFGADRRFGTFPAVSAAWRLSEEQFMTNVKNIFTDLKLRVSYGQTGNQDIGGSFPSLVLASTGVAFGANGLSGIGLTQLGVRTLGWETNETINLGLDYAFLKGRISGTVEYFWRNTKNLLLFEPQSSISGFSSTLRNVGKLQNRGVELLVITRNIDSEFKWTTDFNITFVKNEVKRLLNPGEDLPNNGLWLGRPLGQQWVARYAGVNPADGRAFWYDKNGEITYQPVANDRVFINRASGSTLVPIHYGGITNTFSYKGFELIAFFQWNYGQLAYATQNANLLNDFRFVANQERRIFDRWTRPGQITDYPRLYLEAVEPGSAPSLFGASGVGHDRFLEDASYIRLKQLTFSYNVPQSWASRLKIANAKIYLQGVNLWTRTNFTGLDPEFAIGTSDIGVVPQGKNYIIGIQIGF